MAYQFSDSKDATIKFQGQTNEAWSVGKINGTATAQQTVDAINGLLYLTDSVNDFNPTDLLRTLKQTVDRV